MNHNTETNTNTNPYGFPVTECDRCGGTGEFSFNQRDGKRCMKCNGKKFRIATRAAKAWDAFQKAKKADAQRHMSEIKVGDKIVEKIGSRLIACEVVKIENDRLNDGLVIFTFKNGIRLHLGGPVTTCEIHNPEFDPAPFLAQIKEAK